MSTTKAILTSIILGIIIGLVGMYLMGYIAAIAIPKEYFLWFEENLIIEFGTVILLVLEQFFAYGILALGTGYILGKVTQSNWLANSVICYLSVLFYFSIGSSLVYGGSISNPFENVFSLYFLPSLVLPTCLMLSTYIAYKRYSKHIE